MCVKVPNSVTVASNVVERDRPNARCATKQSVLRSPDWALPNRLGQVGVCLLHRLLESGDMSLQIGTNPRRGLAAPMLLGREHVHQLTKAYDQSSQGLGLLIWATVVLLVGSPPQSARASGYRARRSSPAIPLLWRSPTPGGGSPPQRELGRRQRPCDRDLLPTGGFQYD